MPALPRELRGWVAPDEPILLRSRPSWRQVALSALAVAAIGAVIAWGALALVRTLPIGGGIDPRRARAIVFGAWLVVSVAWTFWVVLVRTARDHVLTTRRVMRASGVLRRGAAMIPLERLQHVVVDRTLAERLLGIGSLGFASAGAGGTEVVWLSIDRPDDAAARVREAMSGASRARTPVVIGLAGGIGAGKSEVARAFERLGCVISDSDRASREALDLSHVRARLVEWWGPGVLTPEGKVDRSKVAAIVFERAPERARLEALVHPIVRETRAQLVERARAGGAPGVVIDAPLLFEAGLEKECDAVVFVETPLRIRLERIRHSRGWDEAELERREKAQLPLDEKRRRSDYVVSNDADTTALVDRVRRVFDQIRQASESAANPGRTGL